MVFGQLVVGPPGSGKTTYCYGLQQFYELTGRPVAVINLDPANDRLRYDCAVDVADLVCLETVQETLNLGPNGGLIYCIEYLEENLDWLIDRLKPLAAENKYFLFDCPGQVELFTLHGGLQRIMNKIASSIDCRLAAVQLIDAHLCSDAAKYMAALLLALSTMLHLELPQVNVLSKFDLVEQYGELDFSPEYYLRAQGLEHVAEAMQQKLPPQFQSMSQGLCEVVEDFGLLQFSPLAIEDKESVAHVVAMIDKANGFVFTGLRKPGVPLPEFQYSAGLVGDAEDVWERMKERYCVRSGGAGEEESGGGIIERYVNDEDGGCGCADQHCIHNNKNSSGKQTSNISGLQNIMEQLSIQEEEEDDE